MRRSLREDGFGTVGNVHAILLPCYKAQMPSAFTQPQHTDGGSPRRAALLDQLKPQTDLPVVGVFGVLDLLQ